MKEKILEKIRTCGAYAVELQRGLTAIPALSPSSGGNGEYDKAAYLEKELKKLAFDSIDWFNAPQKEAKNGIRPNIVARYKGKKPGRTLWIMSHLDIVPPGELSLWKSDPYKLRIEGRRLIGRGTEDNQQAIVSSIIALKAMMDLDFRPEMDIALLFCADEETGSAFGADYLTRKHRRIFGADDMFFVPDSGTKDGSAIEVAEKSIMWLKVTTRGRQCHASRPDQGINAFKAASELAVEYGSLYRKFPRKDALYDPPFSTFEPTKKEANVPNVNTIPGEDVFYMDCRVMPDYRLRDVKAEMRRIADGIEKKHKVKIAFEASQEGQAAPPTSPDSPIILALKKAVREIYRVKPRVHGIGGGTVAASFRRLGLPAAVYARIDERAHQPNEYCVLDNILGDAGIFAVSALLLGGLE